MRVGKQLATRLCLQTFWTVLVGFLKTKTTVDADTEKAWMTLGKEFSDECLSYLATLGLPH